MRLNFIENVKQYLQSLEYVVFQRWCLELNVSLWLSLAHFTLKMNVHEPIPSKMNTPNSRGKTTEQR